MCFRKAFDGKCELEKCDRLLDKKSIKAARAEMGEEKWKEKGDWWWSRAKDKAKNRPITRSNRRIKRVRRMRRPLRKRVRSRAADTCCTGLNPRREMATQT